MVAAPCCCKCLLLLARYGIVSFFFSPHVVYGNSCWWLLHRISRKIAVVGHYYHYSVPQFRVDLNVQGSATSSIVLLKCERVDSGTCINSLTRFFVSLSTITTLITTSINIPQHERIISQISRLARNAGYVWHGQISKTVSAQLNSFNST